MRIYRHSSSEDKNSTVSEISLDENNEFHELRPLSYEIQLEIDEHKKAADDITICVIKAISHGIHVYCAYSKANRFILCGKQLATSTDSIIAFSTSEDSKYEILEAIVKDLISTIRKDNEKRK